VEPWTVQEEDRPYIRPVRRLNPWWVVGAIGLFAWLGAFSFRHWLEPPAAPQPPAQLAEPPAPPPAAEPAIRHPLEAPPAASLPTLENSDTMMRESVAGLIGAQAFADLVIPAHLVRRIVATVDNLPRSTAPTRVMPLNSVPGLFLPDGANYGRYTPYVRVLESVDAHALVQGYARAYPLFQRAYEELGFPGKYFNDRLMAAIDDLIAAPELDTPPALVRPKVVYEYADPDLETRSAGQKIMLRIGRDNAARVKAKLWEIRREIIAASQRR
jgi:hypothetical protein